MPTNLFCRTQITFYNNELSKRINDDLSIETLESLLDRDAEEVVRSWLELPDRGSSDAAHLKQHPC